MTVDELNARFDDAIMTLTPILQQKSPASKQEQQLAALALVGVEMLRSFVVDHKRIADAHEKIEEHLEYIRFHRT